MPAHSVTTVLVPAVLTGLATAAGAVPFLVLPSVSRRTYDTLLGLGAGLMLAAATLGLLASALRDVRSDGAVDATQLALVLAGFVLGVALLYLMDRNIPHEHAGGHHAHVDHGGHDHGARAVASEERTARAQGLMVVGVMALHRLPEGVAIGAAYAAHGASLGPMLAAAIAMQNAVEGMVMAAPLRRGGLRTTALLGLVLATGMAVPVAALVGFYLSSQLADALPAMLAMGAGALLYLTCNEVIPESHSHGNEVQATFGLLAGFAAIIVVQALLGHPH